MGKRTIIAAALALAGLGCAGDAHAGARFETGEKTPITAAARLDFTIVIPPILTLALARDRADSMAPAVPARITVLPLDLPMPPGHAATMAWPQAYASSNAGTMAGGVPATGLPVAEERLAVPFEADLPAEATDQPPILTRPSIATVSLDTHPATFLVALP